MHPTLPVSFGRDNQSRWSLIPGAYASGSKRSHTGGKCITGLRLTSSNLHQWCKRTLCRKLQYNYSYVGVRVTRRKQSDTTITVMNSNSGRRVVNSNSGRRVMNSNSGRRVVNSNSGRRVVNSNSGEGP